MITKQPGFNGKAPALFDFSEQGVFQRNQHASFIDFGTRLIGMCLALFHPLEHSTCAQHNLRSGLHTPRVVNNSESGIAELSPLLHVPPSGWRQLKLVAVL